MQRSVSAWLGHIGARSALGAALLLLGCGGQHVGSTAPPPTTTASSPPPTPQDDATARVAREGFERALIERRKHLADDELRRRQVVFSLGFHDATGSPLCVTPPPTLPTDLDLDQSLWIHDRATLDAADFSLEFTLSKLASQAVAGGASGTSANSIFTALWDTQNDTAHAVGSGPHCSDDGGRLNGFANSCRLVEGAQAGDPTHQIPKYWPIGIINRLDLAHEGWRNCGEHRIIYGRNDTSTSSPLGRAFIIFEGLLPNPRPGCRSACEPVAEFWQGLKGLSPSARAASLHQFFYDGLPGFEPVVQIDHYTADGVASAYGSSGGGQIRTNVFMAVPWELKEFRLALSSTPSTHLSVVPTMLKTNPFGALWDEHVAATPSNPLSTLANRFEAEVESEVAGLSGFASGACPAPSGGDINKIGYAVSLPFDTGEEPQQIPASPTTDYAFILGTTPPLPGLFKATLASNPESCGLSPSVIAKRAQANSCGGCHDPIGYTLTGPVNSLGSMRLPDGTTTEQWPDSLGFVHAGEAPVAGVHPLSPALTTVFLPERRRFLAEDVLSQATCPCEETFHSLNPPLQAKAVTIEEEVTRQLAPEILRENERLKAALREAPGPKRAAAVQSARARVRRLEQKREQARSRALESQHIILPPLTRELKPQISKVPDAPRDPEQASVALEKAVQDAIRAEPPRRTVTGSFRVH